MLMKCFYKGILEEVLVVYGDYSECKGSVSCRSF